MSGRYDFSVQAGVAEAQAKVAVAGGSHHSGGVGGYDGGGGNSHLVNQGVLAHHSVETVDGVSDVVHGAAGAVRVVEGVLALDDITITNLSLALGVTGVRVGHAVRVLVLGMRVVGLDGGGSSDNGAMADQAGGGNHSGSTDETKAVAADETEAVAADETAVAS